MHSVTQDMRYRQSLLEYAQKHGVSRASRKYNKSRSYIYFWRARYDGTKESLADRSRRPHSHPNQHRPEELKLIRDMHRRNPKLGMIEFWWRLKQRGYTRRPESLYRVMRKLDMFPAQKPRRSHKSKPYEQMLYPGQRVQIDVKVVPRACIADPELRLFQYTAIDEYSRIRCLGAYPEQSTYSSADFLTHMVETTFADPAENGRVGVVVPHGVLFRGGAEGRIRQAFIEENLLDGVIGLPANLFFGTGIPAAILVFKRHKADDTVMFVDASRDFEPGTPQNKLRPADIERIVAAYRARAFVDKYAYCASFDEVKENDFNLNIPRYVDTFEPEPDVELDAVADQIAEVDENIVSLQQRIQTWQAELGLR